MAMDHCSWDPDHDLARPWPVGLDQQSLGPQNYPLDPRLVVEVCRQIPISHIQKSKETTSSPAILCGDCMDVFPHSYMSFAFVCCICRCFNSLGDDLKQHMFWEKGRGSQNLHSIWIGESRPHPPTTNVPASACPKRLLMPIPDTSSSRSTHRQLEVGQQFQWILHPNIEDLTIVLLWETKYSHDIMEIIFAILGILRSQEPGKAEHVHWNTTRSANVCLSSYWYLIEKELID